MATKGREDIEQIWNLATAINQRLNQHGLTLALKRAEGPGMLKVEVNLTPELTLALCDMLLSHMAAQDAIANAPKADPELN